ncbi:MAG: hypothetical protein WC435_01825 [Candidatus Paceibacterota bacterium]
MYHELTKQDIKKFLKVSDSYRVDAVLVSGTNPRKKEHPYLYEALEKINVDYQEETIENEFFGEIKSFFINGKRIWFDAVYGSAYLSEFLHVASLLGSKANVLLGSCGALREEIETGEIVIPSASFGNESATRMYQRDNDLFFYAADVSLSEEFEKYLPKQKKIHKGKLIAVQAMLAETKEDVTSWENEGYLCVDMESATVFSVSKHFNVPAAALLYVADNLIKNELTTDENFSSFREKRKIAKKENYLAALKLLLEIIK